MLKDTIFTLYSKEGRSISYISRLLNINRRTLSAKIREFDFPEAEPRHHLTPSSRKFLNRNRDLIRSRLDNGISVTKIAEELGISRSSLSKTYIPNDPMLKQAHSEYIHRLHDGAEQARQKHILASSLEYITHNLPNEQWKPVLGFDGYCVSNQGRVRHYAKRCKAWHLLKPTPNERNGREYVAIRSKDRVRNFQLSRLVAHAFCDGYDDIHNIVNHKDGDVHNNKSENLEWVSQAENNTHAYRQLNRAVNHGKRYDFSKILYNSKYEFKTVAAFSRFIGMSETQTRRYIDDPERHNIQLIK